jgi:hypothetical protein
MADILCPVCGKANPADASTCQFCEAPLKTSAFTPDFDQESDLPDWLRSLNAEQNAFPITGPAEPPSDLPDWLRGLGGETKAEQIPEEPAASVEPESGKPDWLSDLISETPAEPLPADLPDWLAGEASLSGAPFTSDEQDWSGGQVASEDTTAQPETGGEGASTESLPSVPAFTFDAFEEPLAPESTEGKSLGEEGLLSTLPDWVANVAAEEPAGGSMQGEPDLAPAQLPSWLEAMRPTEVEQIATPTEDFSGAAVEGGGPLIGLRGVLSAEPINIRARRSAAYTIKLRVTDEQKQRVALLEQLLADEPKPKALPTVPVITAENVFRLVIALALLLPILWAVVSSGRLTPLPDPTGDPGVMAMFNLVSRLSVDTPVLVAFDYEAGYSGEMDGAAFAVLQHLVRQGVYPALVSTYATGPALAERFMSGVDGANYANLGYIPGGSVGLYGLSNSLHQTLPYDLQGEDVWLSGPLSSVSDVSDFGLVLILVSDPETARSWIEQVGPSLWEAGTALAMVSSAQAGPLVQPYFAGSPRQMEGLVSGLVGGAAYESAAAVSGPARLSWDPFTLGLLVSVFIILIGTVVDVSGKALRPVKKGK